jgi:hypothetical protein
MSKQHKSNQPLPPISNPEREALEQKKRFDAAYTRGWNDWTMKRTTVNPFEEGTRENELWASGYNSANSQYGDMRRIGMNYSSQEQGEQVQRVFSEQNQRVIGVPKKRGRPPKQKAAGQTQAIKEIVPRRFSFQAA